MSDKPVDLAPLPATHVPSSDGMSQDDGNPGDEPTIYRASPRYWVLASVALGASILLIIDMVGGIHWDAVLFSLLGLLCGVWALWMATTRVIVTPEGLWVRRFSATYFVDYQQLLSATIQGRVVSTLSIVYHPRLENGLVDTEHVGSLLVPGLVDQEELLAQIEGRIPG